MQTARLLLHYTRTIALTGCLMIGAGFSPAQSTESGIEQLWRDASAAQQAQQFSRAATLYTQILLLQPGLMEAEVNLGLMYQLTNDLHAAISCFQHVLVKDRTLYAPNLFAGLDYLKLDSPGDALPYLKQATATNPRSVEALVGLANSYLQLHRYPEAAEQFKRVTVMQDGKNADAWYGLGATYLSIEKEAEQGLRPPSSPFRQVLLGEAYLEQGQRDKAIATLKSVADGPSTVPCAHSLLGFAYLRDSKSDEAAQQFQLDWNSPSDSECLLAKLGLAAVHADRAEGIDALRELREAAAIDPIFVQKNTDLYWNNLVKAGLESGVREILGHENTVNIKAEQTSLAEDDWKAGRYSDCSAALAGSSLPLSVLELRLLSRCSSLIGRDELALSATAQLLKAAPADQEALYWRSQSAEQLGLSALSTATRINPEAVSLHVLLGDMLRGKGSLSDAAGEYRRAIALKPGFIAAHLGLARDLNSDNNSAGAEREVQSALNINPDDPEANYLMGEILLNRSEFSAALSLLLKAVSVRPEEAPYVHADLSRIYEEQGDSSLAISEIKQALAADVDGNYYYRLGRLFQKTGNRISAAQALEQSSKRHREANSDALSQKQ